jgi:hypothetical protein
MFKWIRETSEKKRLQEQLYARQEDSLQNGAKTIEDVMTGRLPHPKITSEEYLVLEKLPYLEFRAKMLAIIKKFKPFPHRHYSQPEEIVILDDYTHTYWLSTIRDNVAKKFKEKDFSLQDPKEEFIKRCLAEAYERGFTPGIYDLSREEHISYLSRYWSVRFLDLEEDRAGELLFGKEMHQLAKAIVKAQNDF